MFCITVPLFSENELPDSEIWDFAEGDFKADIAVSSSEEKKFSNGSHMKHLWIGGILTKKKIKKLSERELWKEKKKRENLN